MLSWSKVRLNLILAEKFGAITKFVRLIFVIEDGDI